MTRMAHCMIMVFSFIILAMHSSVVATSVAAAGVATPIFANPIKTEGAVGVAINHVKEVLASLKDTAVPGSLGRLASVLVLHPLDTMKTRAQALSLETRRTTEVALLRSRANFKGVFPAVLGQVPNGLLTCVGYELWKDLLSDKFPNMPLRTRTVICAVLGDLSGHIWMTPAEVLKVQLQLGLHSNVGTAVKQMFSKGAGAWFQGYKGMVMRDVPYRALQLVIFDELSKAFAQRKSNRRLNMGETLLTGALAGSAAAAITTPLDLITCIRSAAAAITTPLDLIKTRLMLQAKYTTLGALLTQALSREGITVLTGSVLPKMLYVAASTASFFAVYEAARRSGMLPA